MRNQAIKNLKTELAQLWISSPPKFIITNRMTVAITRIGQAQRRCV